MKLICYNQFNQDLFHNGMARAVEHAAALGFDGVEPLDMMPTHRAAPIYEMFDARELRRRLDGNGLCAPCCSWAIRRCDRDADAVLDATYRYIEFAAELGASYLHHTLVLSVTPLPDAPSYEQMLSAVLPTAKKIVKRCEEYGMQCLYEPQGMFFNGIAGVSGLLRAVREEYAGVGVCADLGNSLFVDESPLDVTAALIGDARHVHVKDYLCINPPRADLKGHLSRGGVQLVDCRVGEGDCRLAECLALLKNAGYSGAYSIEIDADDDTTRRAMDFVRQNG